MRFGSILAVFCWFGSESYHNNNVLQAISLLIKEQGKLIPEQWKETKEQGSLISPRKHDFSIDKINRREVHLHQLQSLMKSAANGGLEPNTVSAFFPLRALLAPKFLHMPDFVRQAIGRNRPFKHIAANNSCLQNNLLT